MTNPMFIFLCSIAATAALSMLPHHDPRPLHVKYDSMPALLYPNYYSIARLGQTPAQTITYFANAEEKEDIPILKRNPTEKVDIYTSNLPKPVKDTPAVIKARAEFQKEFDARKRKHASANRGGHISDIIQTKAQIFPLTPRTAVAEQASRDSLVPRTVVRQKQKPAILRNAEPFPGVTLGYLETPEHSKKDITVQSNVKPHSYDHDISISDAGHSDSIHPVGLPTQDNLPTKMVPIQYQYHTQDGTGSYAFGYLYGGTNFRNEIKDAQGNLVGSYSFQDANGKLQTVHYKADNSGFHIDATNHPKSAYAPAIFKTKTDSRKASKTHKITKTKRDADPKFYYSVQKFVSPQYTFGSAALPMSTIYSDTPDSSYPWSVYPTHVNPVPGSHPIVYSNGAPIEDIIIH